VGCPDPHGRAGKKREERGKEGKGKGRGKSKKNGKGKGGEEKGGEMPSATKGITGPVIM